MKTSFLRWWLLLWVTIISLGVGTYYGLGSFLWNADLTKLSFLILFVFTTTTGWVGYLFTKLGDPNIDDVHARRLLDSLDACWFSADSMTTLGLIGTVAGFLLMLGPAFAGLEVGDRDSMQEAIASMASGMSTALVTTLVGMVCSLHTKKQLMIFDYGFKAIR